MDRIRDLLIAHIFFIQGIKRINSLNNRKKAGALLLTGMVFSSMWSAARKAVLRHTEFCGVNSTSSTFGLKVHNEKKNGHSYFIKASVVLKKGNSTFSVASSNLNSLDIVFP